MIIKIAPQRRDDEFVVEKNGMSLKINGDTFDFSPMQEGGTLPRSAIACEWIWDDVNFDGGQLVVCLILPVPANYSPEQAYPADLTDVPDGVIQFPKALPLIETA
ncbi:MULTISPECIES: hypothetical protein [Pseudomonas syringae group]|uniref:Uncharacterized protein n=1 Tax=Pseudomonas syringae group genomosp. 3 TaxID=251701 RepID=A0A2K4WJD6_9PSED|nr:MULTISPECIES: hypothetical protein [Pseudomonas syringae group]MCF5649487.1 hypothetical protein [Pseudomonas syringae]SOS36006.1 hypothetical protein CFBP6411_04649 [Pseudomonas syringae group genomosp. 3]